MGTALAGILALAAGVGFTAPPVGACARTLLPGLVDDPETVRKSYAIDATAVEFTWVFGPPLALGLGALTSTGAALAAAGAILLAGTAVFAAEPASRRWRPSEGEPRPRGGSLTAPGMRTLVFALVAVGVVFGAAEVGVAAAAETLHGTAIAGPLLALWGVGSLAGGVLATRLGGGTDSAGRPRRRARRAGRRPPGAGRRRRQPRRAGADPRWPPGPRSPRPTRACTRWSSGSPPPARSPRRSRG